MLETNLNNEILIRKYIGYVSNAKGNSKQTRIWILYAIRKFEEYIKNKEFKVFNKKLAIEYKDHILGLNSNKTQDKLSASTCNSYLRHLKNFLIWSSNQPGYKSKIKKDDIEYLNLDLKTLQMAKANKIKKFPTLEEIQKVFHSINDETDLGKRDKALFAFETCSGMRISALISLPLECFNEETLLVTQDPIKGVKTKYNKTIYTRLFDFDEDFIEYIRYWVKYLKETKLFKPSDPIFPKSKMGRETNSKAYIAVEVEPLFWQTSGPVRAIIKKHFKDAGIEYYNPHKFRDTACYLSSKKCKTPEQIKAVSQNFGHSNINTTLMTYGTLSPSKATEVISKMNFSEKDEYNEQEMYEQFKVLRKMMTNNDNKKENK